MSSIIRADRWQNSDGVAYNSVLQVVSTTKTDSFSGSVTSGGSTDITGLSVTITPKFDTSKILVFAHVTGASERAGSFYSTLLPIRLVRGSTNVCVGDAAGNRTRATTSAGGTTVGGTSTSPVSSAAFMFLDSPATTTATTYKIQAVSAWGENATLNFWVNRGLLDGDNNYTGRFASSITVMEIAQ